MFKKATYNTELSKEAMHPQEQILSERYPCLSHSFWQYLGVNFEFDYGFITFPAAALVWKAKYNAFPAQTPLDPPSLEFRTKKKNKFRLCTQDPIPA